jgi:Zn-dependent alcohol dehydrogenase
VKTVAAVLRAVTDRRPYTASRPMSVEEVELGEPRRGEMRVRLDAVGVCHSDLSVVDGSRVRPLPMALGHEAAGVVEKLGEGVTGVKVGDHVVLAFVPSCGHCPECGNDRPALCVPGAAANAAGHLLHGPPLLKDAGGQPLFHLLGISGFARHAVVARESAVVIPKDVPLQTAALFGCAVLTGTGAVLNSVKVRRGQSLAVFGLGGVGLAAVMGAAVAGADPIIAVDPVESKRRVALELGATTALKPDDAAAALKGLPGGGVDFAFEAAGVPAVLEAAFKSLKRGGTAVAIGLPHPAKTVTLTALDFAGAGKSLVGSYLGSSSPQRDIPRFLELWKSGKLPVEKLHTATLPLSQINEAFEALANGSAIRQILLPG